MSQVSGDTLNGIAQRNGVTLAALQAANPQVTNPDQIFPGQVIEVPAASGRTYTVVSGDTLGGIAQRFGVTLDALKAANPQITNPDQIFPGQVINIPGGTPPKTYTVVSGDTMTAIAARWGISLNCLIKANPQITDPNVIRPGDVLNIPTPGSTFPYTVVAGDFMFGIATKYGITLAALQAANPQVTNPASIFPGQVLNIPAPVC
ncbi:MAG: hypothetical protein M1832_003689 [Thelocarpon impressellum]|nr:MAG: hypothetical protein M1832_003689 [Thelocarpon impressellum]